MERFCRYSLLDSINPPRSPIHNDHTHPQRSHIDDRPSRSSLLYPEDHERRLPQSPQPQLRAMDPSFDLEQFGSLDGAVSFSHYDESMMNLLEQLIDSDHVIPNPLENLPAGLSNDQPHITNHPAADAHPQPTLDAMHEPDLQNIDFGDWVGTHSSPTREPLPSDPIAKQDGEVLGDSDWGSDTDGEDDDTPAPVSRSRSKARSLDPKHQCGHSATCPRRAKPEPALPGGQQLCGRHIKAWMTKNAGPPTWDAVVLPDDVALAVIRPDIQPPRAYANAAYNDPSLAQHAGDAVGWTTRFHHAAMTPHDARAAADDPYQLQKHQETFNFRCVDRRGHEYAPLLIAARLSLLFPIARGFHLGGPAVYGVGGDNAGYRANTKLTFVRRLEAIEAVLRVNKRVVMDVIEGRGVEAFVKGPLEYAKRKNTNKKGNVKRTGVKREALGGEEGGGVPMSAAEPVVAGSSAGGEQVKPPPKAGGSAGQSRKRKRAPEAEAAGESSEAAGPASKRRAAAPKQPAVARPPAPAANKRRFYGPPPAPTPAPAPAVPQGYAEPSQRVAVDYQYRLTPQQSYPEPFSHGYPAYAGYANPGESADVTGQWYHTAA